MTTLHDMKLTETQEAALMAVGRDYESNAKWYTEEERKHLWLLPDYWNKTTRAVLIRHGLIKEPIVRSKAAAGRTGHLLTKRGIEVATELVQAEDLSMNRKRLLRDLRDFEGDFEDLIREARERRRENGR